MLLTPVFTIHQKNINDLIDRVNIELSKINSWFVANHLIINEGKNKFMVYR